MKEGYVNLLSLELLIFVFTSPYPLFNILLTIPSSIIVLNIFFSIIKTIGPINNPNNPVILNPVYIAIKVKIGCIPILLLTTLGSAICLVISIIIYKIINATPKLKLPLVADIIAHGIIIVPEPKYWQCIYKCNS